MANVNDEIMSVDHIRQQAERDDIDLHLLIRVVRQFAKHTFPAIDLHARMVAFYEEKTGIHHSGTSSLTVACKRCHRQIDGNTILQHLMDHLKEEGR